MIKRDIFLLVLSIYNIINHFYINEGCYGNNCKDTGTSKEKIK